MINPYFINVTDVLLMHDLAIKKYGGVNGVRDHGLLESAVTQPQMFIFGRYIHNDIFHMAAAYSFHLIKNHPFVDGNKRTGMMAALTFLEMNGIIIKVESTLIYNQALAIAESKCNKEQIAEFFKKSLERNS